VEPRGQDARTQGLKVWHRFSDRTVRSERHYYTSLNYIHANAVKRGCVSSAHEWAWGSLRSYVEQIGRERLVKWWVECPVGDYGKGWDEMSEERLTASLRT